MFVCFHFPQFNARRTTEGLFSAANIFSSLKLVYIFSVNPHLGPLQVSLSRMVMDIMKFFFLYVLVLFAFSSGLNQLLWYVRLLSSFHFIQFNMNFDWCRILFLHLIWFRLFFSRYYADLEKSRCPDLNVVSPNDSQSLAAMDHNACYVWRRFAK